MTTTKTTTQDITTVDAIRDVNERLVELGRKAGVSLLDAYESTGKTFADFQDKITDTTQIKWLGDLGRAQTAFTREVTKVYATTGRNLLVR